MLEYWIGQVSYFKMLGCNFVRSPIHQCLELKLFRHILTTLVVIRTKINRAPSMEMCMFKKKSKQFYLNYLYFSVISNSAP